ncbi:hypothetical protein N7G274_000274 [Stereocaulon virgatum]|uniref:Uncharacterized protein n=1 Tax=Stereocaulon virgatum TaxID=373712 RepID=A0ABR4ATB0_9LECA
MPTEPIRTTRSGRICKQTSRSSLAEHRPATTSTSRSRNRDASANTPSTRKKGQASTSASYNPTRAALLEELLEQGRQKAQQPEDPEVEEVEPEDPTDFLINVLTQAK